MSKPGKLAFEHLLTVLQDIEDLDAVERARLRGFIGEPDPTVLPPLMCTVLTIIGSWPPPVEMERRKA